MDYKLELSNDVLRSSGSENKQAVGLTIQECGQRIPVGANAGLNAGGVGSTRLNPNDLWRRSKLKAQPIEVCVAGDDAKPLPLRQAPYLDIRHAAVVEVLQVVTAGKQVSDQARQGRRQILVEQETQTSIPAESLRWRSEA